MEIINSKVTTIKLLQKIAKICYICKEKFEDKHVQDKKYFKVRDHRNDAGEYRGTVCSICNLRYSVPKEIPIIFHNGSNYDYHFIIKEIAVEFEVQFISLVENIEKYITFTVSIEKKVTRIDKKWTRNHKDHIL